MLVYESLYLYYHGHIPHGYLVPGAFAERNSAAVSEFQSTMMEVYRLTARALQSPSYSIRAWVGQGQENPQLLSDYLLTSVSSGTERDLHVWCKVLN